MGRQSICPLIDIGSIFPSAYRNPKTISVLGNFVLNDFENQI